MTNAEKFENVFGFKPNSNLCYAPLDVECPPDCDDCPYISWLNDEYVAESKQGEQKASDDGMDLRGMRNDKT